MTQTDLRLALLSASHSPCHHSIFRQRFMNNKIVCIDDPCLIRGWESTSESPTPDSAEETSMTWPMTGIRVSLLAQLRTTSRTGLIIDYCSVLSHYWSYDSHSAHKTLSLDRRITSKIRTKLPDYFITKEAHEEHFHRKSESCKAGEERWQVINI